MDFSNINVLSSDEWLKGVLNKSPQVRDNYCAMYSSWWQGIVTNPNLMFVPVDDHQVHRGDAVFEAIKVINQKIYLVKEHLDRLDRSAKAIGLTNPATRSEMITILEATFKASKLNEGILRVFLSRGPGSFSPNPYDTQGAQIYVVATKLQPLSSKKVAEGVSLMTSKIPPKESWLAQIKSCNYLQNVLMKKEAVDHGVDFSVGVGVDGSITEGSTENLIFLSKNDVLVRPLSQNILLGTTMLRAFELAKSIKAIRDYQECDFTVKDLLSAKEIMMVGTTLDVVSVTAFDSNKVTSGKPGEVSNQLRELLIKDQNK